MKGMGKGKGKKMSYGSKEAKAGNEMGKGNAKPKGANVKGTKAKAFSC